MDNRNKNKAEFMKKLSLPFAYISLFSVMVLIFAAMYDGPVNEKSPAGKFLYDYQTLITGMLAVLASFITITQMRRTEDRQAEYADAAMALTIREEFLIVERLHTYAIEQLGYRESEWSKFSQYDRMGSGEIFEKLLSKAYDFPDYWEYLDSNLRSEFFDEAKKLFNGKTRTILIELNNNMSDLKELSFFLFGVNQGFNTQPEIDEFYDCQYSPQAEDIAKAVSTMHELIAQLKNELQHLHEIYREVVSKSTLLRNL